LLTQLKITNDALNQLGKQCGESLFDQLKQSFAEVAAMEFDPVQWIVQDILPAGVSMLCAKPKQGKSWFALDLAMAVAAGASKGDAKEYAMSNERREIVDCIKGGITHYKNIAEYLGKKPGTVWKNLKDMANSGQVTPKGKGHYELVDQFTPQCAVDTVDKSLSTTSTDHLPSMVDDGRRESSIKNNGLSDLSTVSTASTDDLSGS
jgi:hypothetical protein